MGIDMGEKVRDFNEMLVKGKIHTKQSEIVSDALRQLFIKYRKEVSIEDVREITRKASEQVGKSLSEEVATLREEIG